MAKLTDIDVRSTETVYSLIRPLDHTVQTERVHVRAQPVGALNSAGGSANRVALSNLSLAVLGVTVKKLQNASNQVTTIERNSGDVK